MASTALEPYRVPQLEAGQRPGSDAIFNSHSTDDILVALQTWKSTRVLLVHSTSLAATSSHINELKTALGSRLIATKGSVGAHSPYADIIEIAHKITSDQIDCIVCVGSGSYSDACKTARLMSATLPVGFGEADMEALVDASIGIAPENVIKKAEGVKLILVPTSLSAGEWNYAASCTNSKGKKQHFALKDGCAGDLVLMDPWLAKTTPETLWLSSGVRAIDHCVEMLCHAKIVDHPDAQEWCEQALKDLIKGLLEYKEGLQVNQGDDDHLHVGGISRCQAGSRMALMAFMIYRIGMGPSHAIGHQLGSVAGVMHGITSCIMLPPVLRYTKERNPEPQDKIVQAFNNTLDWHETQAADCVERLVKLLGLPNTLSAVGVTRQDQIEKIIDMTMTDVLVSFGKTLDREEIAEIVYSAR